MLFRQSRNFIAAHDLNSQLFWNLISAVFLCIKEIFLYRILSELVLCVRVAAVVLSY